MKISMKFLRYVQLGAFLDMPWVYFLLKFLIFAAMVRNSGEHQIVCPLILQYVEL